MQTVMEVQLDCSHMESRCLKLSSWTSPSTIAQPTSLKSHGRSCDLSRLARHIRDDTNRGSHLSNDFFFDQYNLETIKAQA